jgi:putative phage-type endonuclease
VTAAVVIPVVQRTPEWVEARRSGIGASEAAAAIGLSPWESPLSLWARKCGLVPDQEVNDAMVLGQLMEPVLAQLYKLATGEDLRRRNQLLRHPVYPWMLASLDRVRTGRRIVELKHTASGAGYGEPGTDEVPDLVLAQVIHQMAVLDAPEADVAVLVAGRAPLRIYTVRRDADAEAIVIDQEREFWRHVEERTEPPVDGSEATARALAAMYPRDDGEEVIADADVAAALAALRDVRAQIETHRTNEAHLRAVIESAMGDASALVAPGVGRVTWKAPKDSQVVDWKAAAADLKQSVVLTTWETAVFLNTTTKPGSRRFLPTWDKEETRG